MMEEFDKALNADPVRIKYKIISASHILSGRITLRSRWSNGMLNSICVKEGLVLDEDIQVVFDNFGEKLYFHKRDNLLLEAVIEFIQNKFDALTSNGLCIKPMYSRPAGYVNTAGKSGNEIYTYEITDLINGKASLPYFLYVTNADGSHIPNAVPILARRVNIHIYKDLYVQFKPGNITISEINSICRNKYEDVKPLLMNIKWGMRDDTPVQNAQGIFKRGLHGVLFKLVDLLDEKSFLPIHTYNGVSTLSTTVIIKYNGKDFTFKSGTRLEELWKRWQPTSTNTYCPIEYKDGNLCMYTQEDLLDKHVDLPTAKGLVLNERVIIQYDEDAVLCFDVNSSVQELLWTLHKLRKGNNPEKYGYTFIHNKTMKRVKPEKVYHSFLQLKEDFENIIDKNVLLIIDDLVDPCPIPSGTSVSSAESVYLTIQKQLNAFKKEELTRYRMWKSL